MSDRRTFLFQLGAGAAAVFLPSLPSFATPLSLTAAGSLPRSTPEEQGISSATVLSWLEAIVASGQEFHSIMIIRHGHVIAEGWWYPYSADHKQELYSLSKSFTGTAIGLAADEKKLSIDDPVISFFPNEKPADVSGNLAALKVKHLLSMSVGMATDSILTLEKTPAGETWEKTFLHLPIQYEPGSRFLYNSGASYMLSSIVKRVTGMSAHEYLRPRLYEPLGITNATWTENAEGVNMGASHLRIRTEDIAKLGQLYLQKGRWNDKQLLSPEWVEIATRKEIETTGKNTGSWDCGYGYQFWRNPTGGWRGDGAYGQYSMVFPDKDMVVAITSESANKDATMHTVWDHLYPAVHSDVALPADTAVHRQLQQRLKSLTFRTPQLNKTSPLAATINGKKFVLEKNDFNVSSVSFDKKGDQTVFTVREEGKPEIVITCGSNDWIVEGNKKPSAHSLFSLRRIDYDSLVAASAGWKDEHTLVLTFRFIETAHGDTLTCFFDGDKLRIQFMFSAHRLENTAEDRKDVLGEVATGA